MLKTINYILLVLLITVNLPGKTQPDSYNLVFPKYIPQNSTFEVSLVTFKKFAAADRLEIYILPDTRLNLNKIELKSIYESIKLNFSPALSEELGTTCFKAEVDLANSSIYPEDFFELLFSLRADNSTGASVKFCGVYKHKEKTLGYIDDDERIITTDFRFYKTQKNAGRGIQITKESQLEFINKEDVTNFLAEFWLKVNDPDISILKVTSRRTRQNLLGLSCNNFQMLTPASEKQSEYISPAFTGKKSWYHISILFSGEKNNLSLYCNSRLTASFKLDNFISADDLSFDFSVNEQGKSYQLDLLRFINFNNSIETSFNNRSYINFYSDSSRVLAQFTFDNNDEAGSDNYELIKKEMQYVKSDAPISARAPELNITLLGRAYELEWSGGDYTQAVSYVLERSAGSQSFQPVFTIQADKGNEKVYSFVDDNDNTTDILYYRVKQVNEDGTAVYSSQVKVGQGRQEPFTLRQNYPNPFNPKTSIDIDLMEDSDIEVTIYNLEGEQVAKLFKGTLPKGFHKFEFNAKELPSGIYIYKVAAPKFSQSKKMLLTK